jgi:UDPglucose 6-dehydrogenase
MQVGVIGLGRLGLPLAGVLAERGHSVVGIDSDPVRVDALALRTLPIAEPEVQELLDTHVRRMAFGTDPALLHRAEVVFIVTPTPSAPDGAFSLEYVEEAIRTAAPHLRRDVLVVVVSTVMPGHMRRLAEMVPCGLAYNPQFIALGSVVRDLRSPDFVLIGADRTEDTIRLSEFYRGIAPLRIMNTMSAEIAKLALNCYVTMKISFANMLGEICDALGADARAVTGAIGCDRRIGHAYLSPGTAYGGPCFPRDNAAFVQVVLRAGATPLMPVATQAVNLQQTARLIEKVVSAGARRVAVLGLAYKPGTPVYEESAGLKLVEALQGIGLEVRAHDPQAEPSGVELRGLAEALAWADCVAVMTPWQEYRGLDLSGKHIIDPWGMYG